MLVPTSAFMTNRRGYPTLPKRHQEFLGDCFRRGVQVVLAGNPCLKQPAGAPAAAAGGSAAGEAAQPPLPQGAVASGPGGEAVAAAHPLHAHWEYLSYLFRKLDPTSEQARWRLWAQRASCCAGIGRRRGRNLATRRPCPRPAASILS